MDTGLRRGIAASVAARRVRSLQETRLWSRETEAGRIEFEERRMADRRTVHLPKPTSGAAASAPAAGTIARSVAGLVRFDVDSRAPSAAPCPDLPDPAHDLTRPDRAEAIRCDETCPGRGRVGPRSGISPWSSRSRWR